MSQSATPAMQNDMTTCVETFEKDMFCIFPHRHGDATGKPATRDKTRGCRKTSISYETSSNFDIFQYFPHVIKQVGMSQSATPATQNDRTTCLETFKKDMFCIFPHRHGDATGQPETRNETRGCRKNSISYETSSNFHSWQHGKRTSSFAASPIDTARPQENQRRETRQVGTPKRAFRARLPAIFTLCSCKIAFSYEFSLEPENLQPQNQCFVRGFRQFSPHRTKCHACHGICALSPLDAALPMQFAKNTQHDTSKVLRLPRKMTMDTSKVLRLPRKLQHIF